MVATLISIAIGVVIGAVAGYFGGWVDDVLMRITEAFQTIPNFVLLLALVAILGSSIENIVLAIGIVSWTAPARLARAEFMSLRRREFVEAVRNLGVGDAAIIFREILPNALPPVVVYASVIMALRDPARKRARLPQPRRSQLRELGEHDRPGPRRPAHRLVRGRHPRRRDHPHRPLLLPAGRGPERGSEPEAEEGMTDAPILEIENLRVALPEGSDRPYALDGLSLSVKPGEIVCLVGESGSGKSLAAGAVMRLLPEPVVRMTGGAIRFEGRDLAALSEREMRALRGDRIAMIFQEPMTALNPQKTVGWQIDEVLKLHTDLPRKARADRVLAMLEQVQIPDPASAMNAYPHQVSGGQRQRVMIAMALAMSPRLVIADEPTTALDVTTQLQILRLIRELQQDQGSGILFITHDFGVVAEIADRVAVLRRGELVEHGPAAEVLNRPRHAYTRALIAAVPDLRPPKPRSFEGAPVVLKAEEIVKTFKARGGFFSGKRKAVAAVDHVSFDLRRGETLGVVGESGSGKTTVSRCVARLLEADSGRAELNGRDILNADARTLRAMRADIQMVFQDPMASLNPRKRVVDLIAQGPIVHGMSPAKARDKARELLSLVELSPAAAERYPHEFSGGQRQRIGIARALALEPKVIVADEPVSALDVSVQAQVLRLLADLRERLELSLLFVTHDLRVAAQLCDRVAVMEKGRIVEMGVTADLFADPQHPYTRKLLSSIPGRDWTPPVIRDDAA